MIFKRIWNDAQETSYSDWQEIFEKLTPYELSAIKKQIQALQNPPLISILMPVYNPDPDLLQEAIDSVRNQIYPHWELCIADDASPNPQIRSILENYLRTDSRIRVTFRTENGNICASSNSALELCTGMYTALMDHDDLLPETALYFVVMEVLHHPDAMLIYSDEDHISLQKKRYSPYFKPDYDEVLILAQNYISHLGVYRTSLLQKIGGFRPGYEGSQDHDLVLRCALAVHPEQIRHIPRILYHWRNNMKSFSNTTMERCEKARRQAVADYLEAQGYDATVTRGRFGFNEVTYRLKKLPLVSCIIPARNHAELTRACLDGLLHRTDYAPLEIILVDNGSTDEDAIQLCKLFSHHQKVRVIHWNKPFNYSEINNMAAREAHGDIFAFLNNDSKIIHPDWLYRLVTYAVQPKIGAVGPKLLYANKTIQHAGVVCGINGVAGHVGRGLMQYTGELSGQFQLPRRVTIVTGACLIVRKELFFHFGGFDEKFLKVAFNDVDFCLKVHKGGFHNIYVGDVELYHLESISRGHDDTPEKQARFTNEINVIKERWKNQIACDPFYSPQYSRHTLIPSLLKYDEYPYISKEYNWKPWLSDDKRG